MGNDPLLEELAASIVDGDVAPGSAASADYRGDEAYNGAPVDPMCVVSARTVADVVATMTWAGRHRVPVVPRGAGTGLAGGAHAVDGCVVLSLTDMATIREISVDDRLARVEAGVVTADLARAATQHGLLYGVDPGSADRSTLGGNLATNAGGFRCLKYGVTRESVLALEVVLPDGRVVRTGQRTTKGVAGYDLTSLFVGSEGTLGIIVGATLRLRPRPSGVPATVVAFFPDGAQAARAPLELTRAGLQPSYLELIDEVTLEQVEDWRGLGLPRGAAMLIGQVEGFGAEHAAAEMAKVFHAAGAFSTDVTSDPAESAHFMGVRRCALASVERLGATLVEDFVVPPSRLADMMSEIRRISDRRGVFIATVAHAGDGNMHPTLMFDRSAPVVPQAVWAAADDMFRAVLDMGGTLTGEHGVGTLKRRWLRDELGADELNLHQAIKTALDPLGIMNPGKVL